VPARIAFAVSSQVDSRVILDSGGAESLLGQGDMLFRPVEEGRPKRVQGAFISEEEIEKLTAHWRRQGEPEIHEELLEAVEKPEDEGSGDGLNPDADDMLGEAIAHRGSDGYGVDFDAPAPPARRVHARGASDRHDGATRRDFGVRGLQGPAGADFRG
jgi:DNA segregation ATPase FtsK/SpoIIIE-like protein